MIYDVTGTLLEKGEIIVVSDKFQKREFTITKKETVGQKEFIDYLKFQTTQDRCGLIDGFTVGETIKVEFNLRGNKWEKDGKVNYFTNLEAWRLTHTTASDQGSPTNAPTNSAPPPTEDDFQDLPF